MRRPPIPRDESPSLDMSSLIDVSFLMLIYFIVTSTLDPKESDLGMTLPAATGCSVEPIPDPMEIEVTANGDILVNEEVVDTDSGSRHLPGLMDRLTTYTQSAALMNNHPIVLVNADDNAKGQRFIDVINAIALEKLKIKHVMITGFED